LVLIGRGAADPYRAQYRVASADKDRAKTRDEGHPDQAVDLGEEAGPFTVHSGQRVTVAMPERSADSLGFGDLGRQNGRTAHPAHACRVAPLARDRHSDVDAELGGVVVGTGNDGLGFVERQGHGRECSRWADAIFLRMNLGGAVAIVTGGGTGIGRAVSESLARAGARAVVINYSRSKEDAEATAASLKALGCEGAAHQASVADDTQVKAMIEETVGRFGRLDVLVNTAGPTPFIVPADLDAVTDQVWDEIIGVNLKGTFYCSRAAAPALKKARGAIVNVASVAGTRAVGS